MLTGMLVTFYHTQQWLCHGDIHDFQQTESFHVTNLFLKQLKQLVLEFYIKRETCHILVSAWFSGADCSAIDTTGVTADWLRNKCLPGGRQLQLFANSFVFIFLHLQPRMNRNLCPMLLRKLFPRLPVVELLSAYIVSYTELLQLVC